MKLNSADFGAVVSVLVLACGLIAPAAWAQDKAAAPAPAAKPPAAAPAANRDALVDQMLTVSGYKDQVAAIPEQTIAGLRAAAARQKQPGTANTAELEKIYRETVTAKGFVDRAADALRKNYDEPRMRAVLEMMSSALGKRMTEMEKVSPSQKELIAFAGSLKAKPLPPARIDLIQKLDTATHSSEVALEILFASVRAMAIGAIGNDQNKIAELDRGIEKNRAAAAVNVRNQVLLGMAYTYRNATDAELTEYISQLASDNGKWFNSLVSTATIAEFRDVSGKVGERIAALSKQQKAAAPGADSAAASTQLAADAPPAKRRSRANEDARHCLLLPTDKAIIRCAEQYR